MMAVFLFCITRSIDRYSEIVIFNMQFSYLWLKIRLMLLSHFQKNVAYNHIIHDIYTYVMSCTEKIIDTILQLKIDRFYQENKRYFFKGFIILYKVKIKSIIISYSKMHYIITSEEQFIMQKIYDNRYSFIKN